jgi:hypothetical protein
VDFDLKAIVDELNQRAARYRIGSLQRLRQQLRGHQRLAGTKLFSMQTAFARYAFHHGGRSELQFNIGLEPTDAPSWLRHGVAFSLEPSQALPTIEQLVSKPVAMELRRVRLLGVDSTVRTKTAPWNFRRSYPTLRC